MYYNHALYHTDLEYLAYLPLPWEILEGQTLLITGASGMVGSTLVDAFMLRNKLMHSRISVVALSRDKKRAYHRLGRYFDEPDFCFLEADVNHPLPDFGFVNAIIHAASNTHPIAYASDPIGTIDTNVIGTKNLLHYAVKHNANRFLFLSSVEIYGDGKDNLEAFKETDMGYIDCNTLRAGYPESKRLGESMCCAYGEKHDLHVVVPRLSRLYGPSMLKTDSKAIAQFIKDALEGRDIVLKSKGNQLFSYCYTTDAVSAILTVLLKGEKGNAYNVSDSNSDTTLKNLASLIADITGVQVTFQIPSNVESTGFSKAVRALLNADKLLSLGWEARDNLISGISKTIEILTQEGLSF